MANYIPVYGVIKNIQQVSGQCCEQNVTMNTENGIINIIISAETYVVDNVQLRSGLSIFAFYEANVPVPLIYPPQYRAVSIGRQPFNENVTMDYFGRNLVNSDNTLRLNIASSTQVINTNGQRVSCNVGDNNLLVFYTNTTRSIPAQTTPRRIIVICKR